MRLHKVIVRAESSPSKFQVFRKKVESNRSPLLKENLNKLTFIATAETKFVSDTLNELDRIHREMFDTQWGKKNNVDVVDADVTDDNIFLKK